MNTVRTIIADLDVIRNSHQVDFVQIVEYGRQVLKARIYIAGDLFVQVYRNDRFDTTNLALILGGRRIYGRDERDGVWHRHPAEDPDAQMKARRVDVRLHSVSSGQKYWFCSTI